MPYSQYNTLSKAVQAFNLTVQEMRFLPDILPVAPSPWLTAYLEDSLPAAAIGSEKARSEGIIYPVLLEVKRLLNRQIAVFSGVEFAVDEAAGLTGIVDFLISRSPQISLIQAPAIVLVEAKKADLSTSYGQCVVEMVAAQRFNQINHQPVAIVYGVITSGTQWRFLQLEESIVTLDLMDYPLPPVDQILGFLLWMIQPQVSEFAVHD